jgi:cytidylate kinase
MVVAIDGPAGAGKSTVARAVAEALAFRYLDTGAMYRAAALAGGDLDRLGVDDEGRVTVDGAPAGPELRTPAVSERASALAGDPAVRARLVELQRAVVADGDWVAEGRDIATVVAPDAAVKVFLTADPAERARRRAAQTGEDVAAVLAAQDARDAQDSGHGRSTTAPAPGAVEVDTTGLAIDQVVAQIVELAGR